jgi:regulator of RNase E activity RraA
MSEAIIKDYPELIPEEYLARARKLSSANLCDGMQGLGIFREGCMNADICAIDPSMKAVGTACTVETSDGDNLPIHLGLFTAPAGYIMVIDGKANDDYAYFGDNMMTTGKVIGLLGMIVDGYIRDREGCIEVGLPVFARGLMPRGPKKELPGILNDKILCGGIQVNPGDLIIADYDGIAVCPRERIAEVLEKAEKKAAYDDNRKVVLDAYAKAKAEGRELPDIAPKWFHEKFEKKN